MREQTQSKIPGIIFFDVVETVFSLAPLEETMTALNLPEGTV